MLKLLPDYLPVDTQIIIKQDQAFLNKLKIETSSPIQVNIDFPPRFPSALLNTVRNNFIKETQKELNKADFTKVILNEKEMFDYRCLQ